MSYISNLTFKAFKSRFLQKPVDCKIFNNFIKKNISSFSAKGRDLFLHVGGSV